MTALREEIARAIILGLLERDGGRDIAAAIRQIGRGE